jgi:hypothetical protein
MSFDPTFIPSIPLSKQFEAYPAPISNSFKKWSSLRPAMFTSGTAKGAKYTYAKTLKGEKMYNNDWTEKNNKKCKKNRNKLTVSPHLARVSPSPSTMMEIFMLSLWRQGKPDSSAILIVSGIPCQIHSSQECQSRPIQLKIWRIMKKSNK